MTRENKTSRSCSPNLQEILAQLWQQAVCIRICHTTDSAQSKLFASHSMKVIAICIRGYLLFGPKRNCASHRAQLPSRALMCAETFFHNKEGKGTVLQEFSGTSRHPGPGNGRPFPFFSGPQPSADWRPGEYGFNLQSRQNT